MTRYYYIIIYIITNTTSCCNSCLCMVAMSQARLPLVRVVMQRSLFCLHNSNEICNINVYNANK